MAPAKGFRHGSFAVFGRSDRRHELFADRPNFPNRGKPIRPQREAGARVRGSDNHVVGVPAEDGRNGGREGRWIIGFAAAKLPEQQASPFQRKRLAILRSLQGFQ